MTRHPRRPAPGRTLRLALQVMLLVAAALLPLERALAVCTSLNTGITHRLAVSYCELCGVGEVTLRVSHPGNNNPDLTNLVVSENLATSGLTYIPGTTSFSVNNGLAPAPFEPVVSGPNGSVITWDFGNYVLPSSQGGGPGNAQFLDITFQVRRADAVTLEGLVSANRNAVASFSYDTINEPPGFLACSDAHSSGPQTLPLREPLPEILKRGRNVDASQGAGQYSGTLYGHNNDDVIWRIEIRNNGLAGLQDLRFDDLMQGTDSLVINYACPSEAAATAIAQANGVGPAAGCVAASNTINDFIVSAPFGNAGSALFQSPYTGLNGFEIDVNAQGSAFIYLVGKLTADASCVAPRTNTVTDVQWGCGAQPPAGGIGITSTGDVPGATATLITRYGDQNANLTVNRQLTGTNTSQPVGSKGTMTITITNNTGGTVRNITLANVLPPEYVMDPTYPVTASMNPAYNPYPGMIDNIVWENPAPGTLPLTSNDPADPLANTAPEFTLTSTGCSIGPCAATVHPVYPDQRDMMRHGDVLTIVFRVVLVRSASYDLIADLDERTETVGNGADPAQVTTLTNSLTVEFDTFCDTQGHLTRANLLGNGTAVNGNPIPANPEDIDVDITGAELVFILTNDPSYPLPLTVALRNNGGHDAADYYAYVTFGATMDVVAAPGSCAATTNPPPLPPWRIPAPIPPDATVYECTGPAIAPGQTVELGFQVIKTADPVRIAADDLTFRADVIGEITLSDGTPLWFPTPLARSDGVTDRANDYTLDGLRARVVGFNLLKTQAGACTENNPPPGMPDLEVQIGEECPYHIESGGWFGFQTPGFAYIAVQRVTVVDELPDGQGYLRSTDPLAASTSAIAGVTLNPPGLSPLDEVWIDWTFNQVVPDERITERDHWFRVDVETRVLNDPLDERAPPNRHALPSTNVLNSTFQAVFFNDILNAEELYDLGQNTVGYPQQSVRRVDLTVTEPNLILVKEVCNETLYGAGPSCANWTTLADDGDAFHSYIYRITVTNEAESDGVTRAPAYDVVVTDELDASDLAFVLPLAADGLDNDADTLTDGADGAGEGAIGDNVVNNGVPAVVTFSHVHSSALERIDPGQSVELFYRVDFDDDAAPLQTFTNSVTASYDSLAGASGNQTAPQQQNGEIGGARVYVSEPATAAVRIIPVVTEPKSVTRVSNMPLGGSPQPVAVGEEVEYQLVTSIPVALLRAFVIRDELPAGLRCAEAPAVNLDVPPYAAAGFQPGGVITPTCDDGIVEWNFGDQRVTVGNASNRYDLVIRFIARVENSAVTGEGELMANGAPVTEVTARYVNEADQQVELQFSAASIVVREPVLVFDQAFAVAEADAGDAVAVTVTATNTGSANAYNLRVLGDLAGRKLTFLDGLGGADPPDVVDTTTLGADRPVFGWTAVNPAFAIAPGASISFTFDVRLDDDVQPAEIVGSTIEASWTSLPGRTTALNSGGQIGVDGAVDGMRIGALPNAGDPINDHEASASALLEVPASALSKTDLDPAVIPAIGSHKRFQIEIGLPEGTTNGLVVADDLAASGLSYVLADNADFAVTYEFDGIAAINGQPPGPAALTSVPADGTRGVATWQIGTVTTASEDDLAAGDIEPRIRIVYYARIDNDLDTGAGDSLQNGVEVTHIHGATGDPVVLSATTAPVAVVEPRLTLSKTVANVSPGKQPIDEPAAGDTLEYRVIMANTGTATAFDVNVVDTLPPGLELDAAFVPVATIEGVPVGGFVATPGGAPAGELTWGRGNGDPSLAVPAGETLVITYRAIVQIIANPDGLIENGVLADWTSLEGEDAYERTGAGCPDITPPDDYCAGPALATSTGVRTSLVFWKSVVNASSGADPGHEAAPGDTLRYRILVRNLGGFPVSGFSLVDALDPHFEPGSLNVAVVPDGADVTLTDANGGVAGTGLLDVRNLVLAAAGAPDEADRIVIEFEATLVPVIANGTVVANQAQLLVAGEEVLSSDDPFDAAGPADPDVPGEAAPTLTLIASAPAIEATKRSQYLEGDPEVLRAGETLRYAITVRNTGSEHATGVAVRDAVPANTTYVPGSTTLNGVAVADVGGASPLQAGMTIATSGDAPGFLRADPGGAAGHVAIVTFDVVVSPEVIDGTILSNQAFVTGEGGGGSFPEQPSDDPRTPIANDPTRDVVGNVPLLFAHKTVELLVDAGSPGIVDPLDVLRYTITLVNPAATPATGVVLTDPVPANTTYVAGSLRLDGTPVAGAAPPVLEVDIGMLPSGGAAVVTFEVEVDAGVATGTVISNQGNVVSSELAALPTCADSDPSVACRPTIVVVGDAQLLTISKEVAVVGGGAAEAGGQLEFVVRVTNVAGVPATAVVITDDLNPVAGQLAFVPGSATLAGATNGVAFAGGVLTADYAASHGNLPTGATAVLRFRADIADGLATGTTLTNTAVVTWNTPAERASAAASIDIGGVPGSAILNGRVWHDADFDDAFAGDEAALAGWSVQLLRSGQTIATGVTDAEGLYRFSGVTPNGLAGEAYEVVFAAPGAGPTTAALGETHSAFTNGLQRISDIVAPSGSNLQGLNLPIEPNGVVYHSVLRTPVAGAVVTMRRVTDAMALPAACFDDPAQQGQVTLADGFYKFDLNFGDAACPAGADYVLEVAAPGDDAGEWPSRIIPPASGEETAPYSVPACPDDAVGTTARCEAQAAALAPSTDVPARSAGTRYYLNLTLGNGAVPEDSQLFNNHLPVDPELEAAVSITKTSPMVNVTRAALVPYTITVRNMLDTTLQELSIIDTMPPGFRYVEGSARLDGVPGEPAVSGRELSWEGIALQTDQQREIRLLLVVGAGVGEGDFVNTAQVIDTSTGSALSGIATATVRVVPDPAFDCTDIIGKVFDDADLDGHQGPGERGLSGVRIVSARGLIATTDAHGRFHITCAAVPDRDRGSNFILKLDERSLPSGYRLTTVNPQVQRVTRGKMAKFNFGAAIHRVVGLGVAGEVFEPGTAEMRPQWNARVDDLIAELARAPSLLRITYYADLETEALVDARIDAIRSAVAARWPRRLTVETEIYWRRGAPVDTVRSGGGE